MDAGAVQQICQMSQELRSQEEPQPTFRPVWPHSIYDVRCSFFERPQQRRIILRVIFEVRVLDQDVLSARALERRSDCRALAIVLLMTNDGNSLDTRETPQSFPRAVRRAVVYDDDFFSYRRSLNRLQELVQVCDLVIDRHDH